MNTPLRIRRLQLAITLAVSLAAAQAAELPKAAGQNNRAVKSGDWVFSILPKTFQKDPILDMTVYTEFTPYGRLLRAATPDNPVYYVGYDTGYKQLGQPGGGEHPPKAEDVERVMARALAVNGFLAEGPEHRANLAVFYVWGSHNKLDPETARSFPELARKYKLERAILVGGKNFANGMSFAMEYGDPAGDMEEKTQFLREQAQEELYYVVASAYDYQSLAHGQRKLAWRTTMTVTSAGLALRETLSPLIANAAPFFGRETHEPQIAMQRVSREGRVEIGEAKVIEDKPAPPAAPTAKPEGK